MWDVFVSVLYCWSNMEQFVPAVFLISNPQIRQNDHNLQTAKLHGGCILGSKTFDDNTAQLTRSPFFSSRSTDVPKGAAVTSSVLHFT